MKSKPSKKSGDRQMNKPNKPKLSKFCLLPKIRVEVERKVHNDKSLHVVYWEWCQADGTRPVVGSQPQNKIGIWKIFVDVVSADKSVRSYDVAESEEAWQKLLDEALLIGYRDDDSESHECYIDLQNGTAQFIVTRLLTDEGWVPELKIIYSDKDDFFKTSIECGLVSKSDLKSIIDMLTVAEKSF